MRYETVRTGWRAVLCIRECLCQCERGVVLAKALGLRRERVDIKASASWLIYYGIVRFSSRGANKLNAQREAPVSLWLVKVVQGNQRLIAFTSKRQHVFFVGAFFLNINFYSNHKIPLYCRTSHPVP